MSVLSRRTVLRGVGAAIALPWLESLPAWGRTPPKRFAVLFMGNGISGNHWWAAGSGDAMRLGRSLTPLAPLRTKINVIDGLFNKPALGMGIHPAQTGNLLSGVALQSGPVARSGVTIDQVLAGAVGRETAVPSLVLACEPPVGGDHETGFSMTYGSHISWRHDGSPAPTETDPSRAFDRLLESRQRSRARSVLDGVNDRATTLRRRISRGDTARLDAYLTDLRGVERRIASAGATHDDGDPTDRMRLMCDIVALAFQSDRTRVASLLLARDLSSLRYPALGLRDDHHAASHDDLSDDYERVVRFHVSQLAYLAQKLDAMPEGDGTVLDHTCLLWLSNMWSGWKHDNLKLPVVTVGRLGGALATGRALHYLSVGDDNRRICSLYLALADKMGVALDRFGDAETTLRDF